MYPYDIDPTAFIQSALQPVQPQVQPYLPPTAMPTAPQYFGPAHQALSGALQDALMRQVSVPGLLSAMQNDPALARQIGGLFSSAYTPPAVTPYHIDWNAEAQKAGVSTPAASAATA
ncbi:hypothetical protein [Caudoviricetes sp.]|nr:hypothetical protein [Caudoviricetes sp.]